MRRSIPLVLTGLVVFVVALVVTFPARVAIDLFAPAQVQAWGVEGSVWSGKADAVAINGAGIGSVEWHVSAASLLALRAAADIRVRRLDGFARGRVSAPLFGGAVRLTGLEAALKLASLRKIVPNGTGGEVSARFDELELTRGWPTKVVGRVAVADLQLPGVLVVIGPLQFDFPADRNPPVAQVRSLGGPLTVEGTLSLPGPGRWALDALLGPGENAPRELVQGLAYVGEEAPGGRRRVQYSGGD